MRKTGILMYDATAQTSSVAYHLSFADPPPLINISLQNHLASTSYDRNKFSADSFFILFQPTQSNRKVSKNISVIRLLFSCANNNS